MLRHISVAALIFTGIFGCTNISNNSFDSTETALEGSQRGSDFAANAERFDAGLTGMQSYPNSRTLLSDEEAPFQLALINESESSAKLVISGNNFNPIFEVERISSPDRLVLDLSGVTGGINDAFAVKDTELLSGIRLGAHPNRQRVVVDLAASTIDYKVAQATDTIEVVFTRGADTQSIAAHGNLADSTMQVAAAPAPQRAPSTTDQVTAEIKSAGTEPTEREDESDTMIKLTGLRIEPMAGRASANTLVADVSNTGFYTLKKTAATEYVLTLEGASFDPTTIGTLIAPAGAGAIRSVRPVVQGDNVLLRIFAKDGAPLSASAKNGAITVAAADELSPLAQLKPEQNGDSGAEQNNTAAGGTNIDTPASTAPETEGSEGDLAALLEPERKYTGRLISLDLQETDIDNALRIIAEVSNLNIIASDDVTGKVTLRLIDVPWDQALDVILKTNGLDKVQEGNVIRIAPVEKLRAERESLKEAQRAEEELEPLVVRYIRISYSKGTEIQPVVETVLSERGSVTVDERTNQLIIKDTRKGLNNVVELVKKLDLRTPQVLLETQIVEANRNFLRELGSELGFQYVMSPQTGNAPDYVFPNSINLGGSILPNSNVASSFPAAVGAGGGSAISLLLASADGSRTIDSRISSREREGILRVVSKPSVATINNKQATIKSVTKFRVKLPSGGLNVATGSNATSSGTSAATETIEVGIVLNVTPQASPDYYVLLDIDAKSSTADFGQAIEGVPAEIERSATSSVLISSGQTFALGGIYKMTDSTSNTGVPFLKDVPVLGTLFRNTFVDNQDQELVFFITPRIVEGSFDDAAMRSVF